jgi:putative membrane protein
MQACLRWLDDPEFVLIRGDKMMTSSVMATLHHIFAFTVTACVIYEFIAYRKGLTVAEATRIRHVDTAYGISAGLLIVVGLLRVFLYEKGAPFYVNNPIYWAKMGLFVIVGLLSIYPTIRFLKWAPFIKENKAPEIPEDEYKRIRMLLWLEVIGIALILLVAPMMARGIGMN